MEESQETDKPVFKDFNGMTRLEAESKNVEMKDLEEKIYLHGLTPFVTAVMNERIVKKVLVKELIDTYDPKKQKAKVGGRLLNVNKNALGAALQLNLMMSDVDVEDEENWPAVDPGQSDYADFLHLFILAFMYLNPTTEVAHKIHHMRRVVMNGHPELFDFSRFMWLLVENEILQGPEISECYYGPHIQCLIRSQLPELFEMDGVTDGDKRGDGTKMDDGTHMDDDKRGDGTHMDDGTHMADDKRDDGTDKMNDGTHMDDDKRDDGTNKMNDGTHMDDDTHMERPKVDTTSSDKRLVDPTKKKRRSKRKQSDPIRAPASSVQTEFCSGGGDSEGEESQEDERQENL